MTTNTREKFFTLKKLSSRDGYCSKYEETGKNAGRITNIRLTYGMRGILTVLLKFIRQILIHKFTQSTLDILSIPNVRGIIFSSIGFQNEYIGLDPEL